MMMSGLPVDTTDVRVVELLCSRLCHDLISPVGAINNGVELIDEMGDDMRDEAMALIGQSAARAAARLRCFRLAYGAGGDRAAVPRDEVRAAAGGYVEGGKVGLDWAAGGPAELPTGLAKGVLNLVVLATEVLMHGGTASVRTDAAGAAVEAAIVAEGRSAELSVELRDALAGRVPVDAITPRTIHAYVTGLLARRHGLSVSAEQQGPTRLTLRLRPSAGAG